ncbi:hypothetical protein KC207_08000 [Phycicoccus sp. BSK3Z-2]|uniref:HNH nuclease domain-containing protein n=1 Tax=Phycicoccus avicenniae TaxID=2828860 RepID=A0A941D7H2_9MICO|nr:HNH endonuclease signature motif containing protein [Phycicoccus avicenniae]MBR7743230.1 hypothetical protein [Phycicoccus avicenniae]
MDQGDVSRRIATLRAEAAAVAAELATGGRGLSPEDAFAVAGELQGVVNAAEVAQAAAAGWGARVETTMYGDGPRERMHPVGFVDGMAGTELSLACGVTEGLAHRKARLGAALVDRFPALCTLAVDGSVPSSSLHKVLDACAGLDRDACARVDAEVAPRLAGMDPAAVVSTVRRVASRVAADQVAAQVAATRRGRTVEVRPGEDGLTDWYALVPTETAAAAWSAVEALADRYRQADDSLTVAEARADAFADLLLSDVTVSAEVTLGVPVLTGDREPFADGDTVWVTVEHGDDETFLDADTGAEVRYGGLTPASRAELSRHPVTDHDEHDDVADSEWGPMLTVDGRSRDLAPVPSGAAAHGVAGVMVSGAAVPGLGWVDAATMASLLATVPMGIGRAVLTAETGVLTSTTSSAYTPPPRMREHVTTRDGTCRMWGCTRPAVHCDLDHSRPWPEGRTSPQNLVALCRRHHRMKQQTRWRPVLDPATATLTWHGPGGRTRTTEPLLRGDPREPAPVRAPSRGGCPRAPAATPPAAVAAATAAPDHIPF